MIRLKLTVNQVAKLTGVSVRTLHYYDEIMLLTPSGVTESGYRLYDEGRMEKLQQILFFRELDLELKDIKQILDNPDFDKTNTLKKHKELLKLKRSRLDNLISLVERILKGENDMSFKEFDMTEIEKAQKQYKEEVESRWGKTEAYKESQIKASKYSKDDWANINRDSENIYKSFIQNMNKDVSDPDVQKLVGEWQNHITKYFYDCTDEILSGLGQMYIADERFTKNIDKYGDGLAEFISKAIEYYCNNKKS